MYSKYKLVYHDELDSWCGIHEIYFDKNHTMIGWNPVVEDFSADTALDLFDKIAAIDYIDETNKEVLYASMFNNADENGMLPTVPSTVDSLESVTVTVHNELSGVSVGMSGKEFWSTWYEHDEEQPSKIVPTKRTAMQKIKSLFGGTK